VWDGPGFLNESMGWARDMKKCLIPSRAQDRDVPSRSRGQPRYYCTSIVSPRVGPERLRQYILAWSREAWIPRSKPVISPPRFIWYRTIADDN
jgi:hypothetical protein